MEITPRKAKSINIKEYRRLNNQLRRKTDRAKEVCIEEMCEEIMDLQKIGRYDLMYQKAQKLGEELAKLYECLELKTTKAI